MPLALKKNLKYAFITPALHRLKTFLYTTLFLTRRTDLFRSHIVKFVYYSLNVLFVQQLSIISTAFSVTVFYELLTAELTAWGMGDDPGYRLRKKIKNLHQCKGLGAFGKPSVVRTAAIHKQFARLLSGTAPYIYRFYQYI